mgnify:CR=1 FL=1
MSNKYPIYWHEECLENRFNAEKNLTENIAKLTSEYIDLYKENRFYKVQIEHAKMLGMDGFDRDRFMKGKVQK